MLLAADAGRLSSLCATLRLCNCASYMQHQDDAGPQYCKAVECGRDPGTGIPHPYKDPMLVKHWCWDPKKPDFAGGVDQKTKLCSAVSMRWKRFWVGDWAKKTDVAERICAPHSHGGCGYSPTSAFENDGLPTPPPTPASMNVHKHHHDGR